MDGNAVTMCRVFSEPRTPERCGKCYLWNGKGCCADLWAPNNPYLRDVEGDRKEATDADRS